MQFYVAGFMFDEPGAHVALVRKLRPDWQRHRLNAIGGKVEEGETIAEAMRREFREETGVDHDDWQPLVKLVRAETYAVFFYTAFTNKLFGVRTVTDEPIIVWSVPALMPVIAARPFEPPTPEGFIHPNDHVPNLRWLLPLALERTVGRQDFIVVPDVSGH